MMILIESGSVGYLTLTGLFFEATARLALVRVHALVWNFCCIYPTTCGASLLDQSGTRCSRMKCLGGTLIVAINPLHASRTRRSVGYHIR